MPLKIEILAVGKARQDYVLSAEREYLKRLKPLAGVSVHELEARIPSSLPEKQRREQEAELVLKKVSPQTYFIVLDESGRQFTSSAFSAHLEKCLINGCSHITFALGGASGWDPSVLKSANLVLSLSSFTFSYQLARIILIEQLYRSLSIIKGIPYHK